VIYFLSDPVFLKRNMKNLLSRLVNSRRKSARTRAFGRRAVSFQIAQMGRMGQQLVVASR
jgi:hypothetical protein